MLRVKPTSPADWTTDHRRTTLVFESYRNKYENVRMKREDGILEVALHTKGGPLVFNGSIGLKLDGAVEWSRTTDLLIANQLLY
jgi:hypothetical protein